MSSIPRTPSQQLVRPIPLAPWNHRRTGTVLLLLVAPTLGATANGGCCLPPPCPDTLRVCQAAIDLEKAGGEKAPQSCHELLARGCSAPPGPSAGSADTPGRHHHPASCWIDGTGASDDSQVDLMLVVVGLNHSMPPRHINWGVDIVGVRDLADTIFSAWPHPESIVIVSSAFMKDCAPTSGGCLETELEERYHAPFELREILNDVPDAVYGTLGVISGSRWKQLGSQRTYAASNPEQGIALVYLQDAVTKLTTGVYALHTHGGDAALDEILPTARAAKASIQSKGRIAPIIAGDFNLTEEAMPNQDGNTSLSDPARAILRGNFLWANADIRCSSVHDLPDGTFRTQNGNLMHALLGRLSASDPAYSYSCASASFEPVRLSYSVDSAGRLAARPPSEPKDGHEPRSAVQEGIILNTIGHNVLAIGLRLKRRSDPECDCVCKDPLDTGASCGDRDACGNLCHCQSTRCDPVNKRCQAKQTGHACEEVCNARRTECIRACNNPVCKSECSQEHQDCMAGC